MHDSITRVLFALPDDALVFPGHDYRGRTVTTIGEERLHNPRVAGRSAQDFAALMDGLGLPRPRKMNEAVPANLRCGLQPAA